MEFPTIPVIPWKEEQSFYDAVQHGQLGRQVDALHNMVLSMQTYIETLQELNTERGTY